MRPAQIVEAVLFASDAPLQAEEIARADQALDEDVVEQAIQELQRDYDEGERSYQIREIGGGYQILTRPEYAPYLERFDTVPRPSRLSGPALETLAIIAYRQPIGRIEIEYIRGVGSSGVIRTLQERGLVEVVGRGEGLGRPLLYGTGDRFLEHFGFSSAEELPRPEELSVVLRDRTPLGLAEEEEESPDPQGRLALEGDSEGDAESSAAGTEADTPEFRTREAELTIALPPRADGVLSDPSEGNGGGVPYRSESSESNDASAPDPASRAPQDPWLDVDAEPPPEDRHD